MFNDQSTISSNLLYSKLDKENIEVLKNIRLEILEREYFDKVLIENRNLEHKILQLQHENFQFSTQLHNLMHSISWKLTHSLRWLNNITKNIRKSTKPTLTTKTYQNWIQNYEKTEEFDQKNDLNINFIILIYFPPSETIEFSDLEFTLKSILNQNYLKYKIIIYSDNHSNLTPNLDKFNFKYDLFTSIKNINNYLENINFDFLIPLKVLDQLNNNALFNIAKTKNADNDTEIIYSDHDELIKNDYPTSQNRNKHCFKPNWNKYLFLNSNYISRSFAISKKLLQQNNYFIEDDFLSIFYRLFINFLDNTEQINKKTPIKHIEKVLWHLNNKNLNEYSKIYLNNYYKKFNFINYSVENNKIFLNDQITHPMVSIVIPTKNSPDLISRCILSIIEKTSYKNYEIIIIDNGSNDQLTIDFINNLPKNLITVIKDSSEFNYSKLNNQAIQHARGDYICLLNNDIEVIESNWLNEMMVYSLFPDVGCVGAKLLYANDSIQHAGIILGIGVVAGHQFAGIKPGETSYSNRHNLVQELSAVTGACLLVKKKLYEEVGGLNEINLPIAFNDVDFCLKLKQLGYKNIWTPHALLYHFESVSRGLDDSPEKKLRLQNETNYMLSNWSRQLKNDEYYNRNLSLENEQYNLAFPPRF